MWTLHKLAETRSRVKRSRSTESPSAHPAQRPVPSDNVEPRQGQVERQLWEEFSSDDVKRFPALKKRNFFCVQRHQARAHHYDLRLQLDGGTFSWAIPKGLIGLNKTDETAHIAVETTIHPIGYTVYEGADGKISSSGKRTGTMLWDVGYYTVEYPGEEEDSDSEESRRRKKQKVEEESLGVHEEDKLRDRLHRYVGHKTRTIHFTLHGGTKPTAISKVFIHITRKLTPNPIRFGCDRLVPLSNHRPTSDAIAFILILSPPSDRQTTFSSTGVEKKNWILKLPRHVDRYDWDRGGEDGPFWAKSVKSGLLFPEVLRTKPEKAKDWQPELSMFKGWTPQDEAT